MPERALVIMPTYNEARNLRQIVPLVLDKDPCIELLVVDDNSPDGTGDIADDMAHENARVHVLHREGKLGLGTAYI
ncbi:MAG: glycosyltransferase, partial [Gammaproteobacteria bacterium]